MQFKEDSGFHTAGIISCNAQFDGKTVHRRKRSFQSLVHQQVGIIVKQLHRGFTVDFIGPDSQLRRQVVHGKKLHELPHADPLLEFLADGPGALQGNARDLRQPLRLPLHDDQGLVAEMVHDPGCGPGTHAGDDLAGQVAEDLAAGLGQQALQKLRLELPAVAGMTVPFARDHEPLAHHRQGDGAHHGDGLSAAHIQADDGIAVIVILVNHGADDALYNFHFLFHLNISRRPSATGRQFSCIYSF